MRKHLLFIIIAFVSFSILLLVKFNYYHGFVPDWDESNHLLMGFQYYDTFRNQSIGALKELFINSNSLYPPFYHILTSLTYPLTRNWQLAGIYSNIPFILILMVSLYGLGINLGNEKAGFLAAILTPILPLFLTIQEKTAIDYLSISMFVCSFYLLFKTEEFSNRKFSILFGLTIFLGLLIKWPFVVPGFPFIIYAIVSIYKKLPNIKTPITNLSISFAIALLGVIWYLYNQSSMVERLNFFWNPNGFAQILWANPHGFTPENLLFYLYTIPIGASGVGILVTIFFYLSFLFPRSTKEKYLLGSVISTYIVLTYLNDKSSFYIGYAYPLLMLMTLITLFKIKHRFWKYLLTSIFAGAIIVNFVLTLFNYTGYNQAYIKTNSSKILIFPNYDSKFIFGKWPTDQIVSDLIQSNRCNTPILVFPDNRFINPPTVNFYLAINKFNNYADPAYLHYNPVSDDSFNSDLIKSYDCIISKTENPGLFANRIVIDNVNKYLSQDKTYRLRSYPAPDDSRILLYTKENNE